MSGGTLKQLRSLLHITAITALVVLVLSQGAVLATYVSGFHHLGQLSSRQVGKIVLLICGGIILILGAQKQMGGKAMHLAWLTPLVVWLFYFHDLLPFAVAAIVMVSVFLVGRGITRKLAMAQNSFVDFCVGHTFLAVLTWLIIRFAEFHALPVFQIFFAVLALYSCYALRNISCTNLSNALQKMVRVPALERAILYAIAATYLVYATLYSFYFDDINGYMYAPIRVYLDHGFHFGPDRPGFLTNMSALSLGYGGLFASVLGWDRTVFIFGFKFFHAASYFLGLATFAYSVPLLKDRALLRGLWFVIIGFLPLIVFELIGNYADYYVLLGAMFLGYQFTLNQSLEGEAQSRKALFFEAWMLGMFALVSLKCIPYIIAYFLVKTFLRLTQLGSIKKGMHYAWQRRTQMLWQGFALVAPLFILLIDNVRLTGNPTFPGGNHLWRSPFFLTSSSSVVANRFQFPNPGDGTTFFGVFSLTPQSTDMFSSGVSYFPIYGIFLQTMLYLVPLLLLLTAFKIMAGRLEAKNTPVNAVPSLFLAVGFLLLTMLSFLTVTKIVGPQHRYFFGLPVFITLGFIAALTPLLEANYFEGILKRRGVCALGWLSIPLSLFVFFGDAMNPPPFHITPDHLLVSTSGTDKWLKKRVFYAQVNDFLKGDDRKIMLYYLQDKFFLDSSHVYEMDWYDFPTQKKIIDAWEKGTSIDDRLEKVDQVLCREGFGYFILSPKEIFFDRKFEQKYLRKTPYADDLETLYTLDCPVKQEAK